MPDVKYSQIGEAIGALVEEKQEAYGDSYGKAAAVMRVLLSDYYIEADDAYIIPSALLTEMLTIVRILDKISRIVASPSGDKMSESPYADIAGYAILALARSAFAHDTDKKE
ncbi:MAG: hypothetical protein IMX05_01400 [Hydrogenibacillus schlegelii]|nr:hypothetical protein [Hydrogenibacillus schlegelii]